MCHWGNFIKIQEQGYHAILSLSMKSRWVRSVQRPPLLLPLFPQPWLLPGFRSQRNTYTMELHSRHHPSVEYFWESTLPMIQSLRSEPRAGKLSPQGAVVNCLPGSGFKHFQITTPSMSCPVANLWRESEACVKFMPSSRVRQAERGLHNRKNQPKYGDV